MMTGGDRVALRVRVAASACLVASGLFMAGAGGAIALADPGHGYGREDDRQSNDSIGETIRDGLGNRESNSTPRRHPGSHWGNGRPGEKDPPKGENPQPEKPRDPKPGEEGPKDPKPDDPKNPHDPKDPCHEDPDPGDPPGDPLPSPPQSAGGGGGGAIQRLPHYQPPSVPDMQLPDELQPNQPGVAGAPAVLDAGAGIAAAAPVGAAPIALPVIVVPPLAIPAVAGGAGPGGGASAGAPPAAPRAVTAEPPAGRVTPPASVGSNVAAPNSSYRIGYTEYLRTAGLPQVAALAVPGLFGIMVLTGAGGLLGYRQAKAGHAVHVSGSARFIR
jgi:hypothetical protein